MRKSSGAIRIFESRDETRQIGIGDIDPGRMELLKKHADPNVSALAQKLFSTPQLAERQEVVAAYQTSLELEGDVAEGKMVFKKVCAACHRLMMLPQSPPCVPYRS